MHSGRSRLAGELTFTLLLVAFSVFMLWQAYEISRFESLTSAGAFPMATTLVMVVTGLIIVGQTTRMPQRPGAPQASLPRRFAQQLTPVVFLSFGAAIALYVLALERLGFLLSSYLFLLLSMRVLGGRRWGLNLLVSALVLGAIHIVFQTAFSVVLPQGTLLAGWLK